MRRLKYAFSVALCVSVACRHWPPGARAGRHHRAARRARAQQAPELQVARTEIGVASGQVTQAALRPNPMLSSAHEHEPGGMMITGAEVEWPLDLFRRPARVAVAQRMADVTSLSIRDRERLLASAVREQAGRVLAAQTEPRADERGAYSRPPHARSARPARHRRRLDEAGCESRRRGGDAARSRRGARRGRARRRDDRAEGAGRACAGRTARAERIARSAGCGPGGAPADRNRRHRSTPGSTRGDRAHSARRRPCRTGSTGRAF